MYLLKYSSEESNLVIDGENVAKCIYYSQVNRGLAYSYNPLELYNTAMKFINRLKRYHLKVVRVYIELQSNKIKTKENKDQKEKPKKVSRESRPSNLTSKS